MKNARFRLLMPSLLAIAILSVGLSVNAQPAAADLSIGAYAPVARECSVGMNPRNLGGGRWYDRNYVVEAPINFHPSSYTIYYRGVTGTYRQYLSFHGVFDGRARWGVSTWWAYRNLLWQDASRWTLVYSCR